MEFYGFASLMEKLSGSAGRYLKFVACRLSIHGELSGQSFGETEKNPTKFPSHMKMILLLDDFLYLVNDTLYSY